LDVRRRKPGLNQAQIEAMDLRGVVPTHEVGGIRHPEVGYKAKWRVKPRSQSENQRPPCHLAKLAVIIRNMAMETVMISGVDDASAADRTV
jgi:hypothetical protein